MMFSAPGALLGHLHPPSSSMCKPSPSTSHHLPVSSPPGVLLGRLHAPSHPTTDAATCLCPPVTPARAPGCITALLPTGTSYCWAPAPAPAPMGHCSSHHEPQPGLGDNPSPPFSCSAHATTSHCGLGLGETATLPTQLLPFPPRSRHRPQHGCQDGDRHRCGQPGRDGPVQLRGQPVWLVAPLETSQPLG